MLSLLTRESKRDTVGEAIELTKVSGEELTKVRGDEKGDRETGMPPVDGYAEQMTPRSQEAAATIDLLHNC